MEPGAMARASKTQRDGNGFVSGSGEVRGAGAPVGWAADGGAHLVQVNRDLLQPLDVKVNTEIQRIRKQEREQLQEPPQTICLFD